MQPQNVFQFHNGSIKSKPFEFNNLFSKESFQFHNGSIKSQSQMFVSPINPTFQFHNGSIKSDPLSENPTDFEAVSIPQWFD